MKIFSKIRDSIFNFIEREGDFSLHFFADFIRGNSSNKVNQEIKEKPLNKTEQKVFNEKLKRRKNETQIEYWKREKAMLKMTDKRDFVQKAIEIEKQKKKHKEQMQKRKITKQNINKTKLKR